MTAAGVFMAIVLSITLASIALLLCCDTVGELFTDDSGPSRTSSPY